MIVGNSFCLVPADTRSTRVSKSVYVYLVMQIYIRGQRPRTKVKNIGALLMTTIPVILSFL